MTASVLVALGLVAISAFRLDERLQLLVPTLATLQLATAQRPLTSAPLGSAVVVGGVSAVLVVMPTFYDWSWIGVLGAAVDAMVCAALGLGVARLVRREAGASGG